MARRPVYNPDQIPLITPDSNWKVPTDLPDITKVQFKALDTETKDDGLASGRGPGWVYQSGYVCGVSMAWRGTSGIEQIYVPLRHPDTDCLDKARVANWVRDVTRKGRVIMHNAPYDCGWLKADLNVDVPPFVDDTTCMMVMIDENRLSYKLDDICKDRGIPSKDEQLLREAAAVYGIKPSEVKKNLWRLPARYVGPYAEQDAASTLLLAEDLRAEMEKDRVDTAYQVEMDLIPMVQAMRWRGIRMDVEFLEGAKAGLLQRRDRVLAELSRKLGMRATLEDVRSRRWLLQAFSDQNITIDQRDGKDSFNKDWMRQGYAGRYDAEREGHWLPLMIAEVIQCNDSAEKFIQGFLLDYTHRGRIHASVNQFRYTDDDDATSGTRSHRFSYADPPLQQMPSRPEPIIKSWGLTEFIAGIIRQGFLPEEGEVWGALDYSQQEYRLIVSDAVLMECSRAMEAAEKYRNDPNTDFHNLVVEMTGLIRQRAKDVNFAKSYGAGLWKFCQMTGMSEEDGKRTMSQYDDNLPFVKELGGKCEKLAQQRGFIKLLDGARCHFEEWEVGWLDKEERERGWSEGWPMAPTSRAEALRRVEGLADRPYRAEEESQHPWFGKRLKRAYTHKAMNRRIQGGAARQTKHAMRECWRAGIIPMLQMHDELDFSFPPTKLGREQAAAAREIMLTCVPNLKVPMKVDSEFGVNWGKAKSSWDEVVAPPKKRKAKA